MIANYCFGGEFRKAYVNLNMRKFLLKTFRRSVFVTGGENHKKTDERTAKTLNALAMKGKRHKSERADMAVFFAHQTSDDRKNISDF